MLLTELLRHQFQLEEGMQLAPAIKPTVLLVEADSALRRLIALGLRHRGIDVIEASSLNDLPPATRQPHLLLLDIDSRGKNELSALALIAPHMARYLSTLPVIVLAWEDEVTAQDELTVPFPVTYLPSHLTRARCTLPFNTSWRKARRRKRPPPMRTNCQLTPPDQL